MARLSDEKINEIRNRADIVEILGQYVQLHRSGRAYKCVCPFHDDHSPSMNISQDKQIYKCFACGEGGNVFTFVRKIENISFLEAVYKVAQMTGVEIEQSLVLSSKPKDPYQEALHAAMRDAVEYCSYQLDAAIGFEQREYLKQRGIDDALRKSFQFGYNPDGDAMYRFLHARRHSDEILIACGLCAMSASGMHDLFSERLMIPIHDASGNPIAFTARRIREDQVKYINTAQTTLYQKGNTIFNYHRVKEKIRSFDCVYLVEGAMDVLTMAKAGFDNAVAMLGTAITKEQLALLRKLSVPVILNYDGDDAGRNAVYKFGLLARGSGIHFEIVDNRTGMDGDEIIEAYGMDDFKARMKKTISWIDFLFVHLRKRYDLNNHSQRKEFALELAKEINGLQADFEKDSYFIRLRELTGFDMQQKPQKIGYTSKKEKRPHASMLVYPKSKALHAEYEVLSQMLHSRQAASYFKEELGVMLTPICHKLALYIIDHYRSFAELSVAQLLDEITEDEVKELLLNVSEWELGKTEMNLQVLEESISKLRECYQDEAIRRLNVQIAEASDPLVKAKLADSKIALMKQYAESKNKTK